MAIGDKYPTPYCAVAKRRIGPKKLEVFNVEGETAKQAERLARERLTAHGRKEKMMQLSIPRKCPDCTDGKKGDKFCIVCRGSGRVQLCPAIKPMPIIHETSLSEPLEKLYLDTDKYA